MKIRTSIVLLLASALSCSQSNQLGEENASLSPLDKLQADSAIIFEPGSVSLEKSPEFGITFSKDMKMLFFTSKRGETEVFGIYYSYYKDGKWQPVELAPFSGEYFDADPVISPDGNKLFFFSMRPMGQDTMPLSKPNIWYVKKEGASWTQPKPVEGDLNSQTSGEGYLSFTKSGDIYISSVGRLEGKAHDIFKSKHQNGIYKRPQYVAVDIGTSYSNPFISPNEDYLIIDSRKAGGYGGNDLYVFKKNEGDDWSESVNMGPLINTPGDEGTPSLSPDGKWFFFSRNGDIYIIATEKLGL